MKQLRNAALAAAVGLTCAVAAVSSHAIVVTSSTNATTLASAVAGGGGLNVVSSSLSANTSVAAVSSGTYTNAAGTYNIGDGIVISSGDVNDYNTGPNNAAGNTTNYGVAATGPQSDLLTQVSGPLSYWDVTQLNVTFTTSTGNVFFLVTFGSDEFPEFKSTGFIDAFGLFLDGVNIAIYNGFPVNIEHPAMTSCPGTTTELDGVLNCSAPMLFSASGLDAGNHTLTFILADSDDPAYDSTAYISGLSGTKPPETNVPEPGTLALAGLALAAMAATRRRKPQ